MITINDYPIDCAVSESHHRSADVSDFPVETGSDTTDNVRVHPVELTIEGIVSDTPLGKVRALREGDRADFNATVGQAFETPPPLTYTDDAVQFLEATFEARDRCVVTTSIKTYKNMIMTDLTIPRDATTGLALRFTATFREMIIKSNKRTTVTIAAKKQNLGTKQGVVLQGKILTWGKGKPPGHALPPVGQYEVELIRWVPDNKTVAKTGFNNTATVVQHYFHYSNNKPLTEDEAAACARDMARDRPPEEPRGFVVKRTLPDEFKNLPAKATRGAPNVRKIR